MYANWGGSPTYRLFYIDRMYYEDVKCELNSQLRSIQGAIALSPSGSLMSISESGSDFKTRLFLNQTNNGKLLRQWDTGCTWLSEPVFSPDEKFIALTGQSGWKEYRLMVFDIDSDQPVVVVPVSYKFSPVFSPSGRLVATRDHNMVTVTDLTRSSSVDISYVHDTFIGNVSFTFDSSCIIVKQSESTTISESKTGRVIDQLLFDEYTNVCYIQLSSVIVALADQSGTMSSYALDHSWTLMNILMCVISNYQA